MIEFRTTGDLATRALAVAREMPGVIVCRATAAWLWGLDVLPPGVREQDWDVDVLTPPGLSLPRLPGVRAFPCHTDDGVVTRHGALATDPVRTAVECALAFGRYRALAALDAFLRAGVPLDHLRRRFHVLARGAPSRRKVGELIGLADPRAESPGESWARLLIIDAGLPMPVPQTPVPVLAGSYHLDLGLPRFLTGVEYDGVAYHSSRDAFRHDLQRLALIRSAGWQVIIVHHHDVRYRPHDFLRPLYEILLSQGWCPSDERRLEIERTIRHIAARTRLDHGLR